jgi:membrane fusion protein (multidrug efflux system)
MRTVICRSFAIIILALTAACHPGGGSEDLEAIAAARSQALAAREVRLVLPEVIEERPTLQLVGEVRAFDTVSVSSEVAGRVDRVLAEVGDTVNGGTPLLEVDRATFGIYLDQAAAELAAARAELELAAKDLERKQDLVSDNTIPQAVFDQAQATHELAAARVAAAEAAHRLAERNFDRSVVRAPEAGAITERMVAAGQWAEVGVPLFRLAVGDSVKVAAKVPSHWVAKLSGLEEFEFTVGLSTTTRRARLYSVDPAVEEMSRSFEVVGVAQNSDGTLRPGLFANITLAAPNIERTVWLPVSAVATADLPKVMMVSDGTVNERDVQTGRRRDGLVEILAGLDEGEAVIAEVAGLGRGTPVHVVGDPEVARSGS